MMECVAMILAGGQGSRLGALTKNVAKPAVPFGGKYRIIDFALSNCTHSGIDTVGVLTQYQPLELNTYIGNGVPWDLDRNEGGVYVLPPYVKAEKGEWYKGTANAIYQNIGFVEQFDPTYVLILSGDHIYTMDYGKMLAQHKQNKAAITVAVMPVPWDEAPRFGIMSTDEDGRITQFEEKPKEPKSNLASMGIYIFDWRILKKYLIVDENNPRSENDFGKNVIPQMLSMNEPMYAYNFDGYWKDVGTIESLWEGNMDMLSDPPMLDINDASWRIYSRNPIKPPHYVAGGASVKNCCITEGCDVYGCVEHSVISEGVSIGKGAIIRDSVVMPNAKIGDGAIIERAIVGAGVVVGDGAMIGMRDLEDNIYQSDICSSGIVLIEGNIMLDGGVEIGRGSMVETDILAKNVTIETKAPGKEQDVIMQGGVI